ncbi:uncharacterized protein YlxW (UPF0749 family) [Bacillus mesophilus]|uniref:DUF881 domain-containing protein n=1 Tax=Bacillus mesophilus TaxID=1808955 RepID=A0A6M0Q1V1_9BACI|nr:DUF881 domain-containing protein [Bacillus mesophilus]MBM7659452.1 uncharacterized protein YlxW (UPF0749 family) [Bacillus mesophilus]NEY70325.1 DUF881 domain-containing protein [Bacillus mesophilus]
MKVKGNHLILSFVCIVLGFMISFSYQFTKTENNEANRITNRQWEREYEYRNTLVKQEELNRNLQQELFERQEKIREIEENLADQEQVLFNLVEDVEKLRMYVGEIKIQGPGVEVTLEDASYVPSEANVNNYIVHEGHLHNVINELLISGANAIAINGQRIFHDSYISCIGPVVSVDGTQHPAPFVITAVGDSDVLDAALNITGGVKDQLVNDNINVKIAKQQQIILEPQLGQD